MDEVVYASPALRIGSAILSQRVREHEIALDALVADIEGYYDRQIAQFDTPGDEPSSITADREREIIEALDWVRDGRKMLQVGLMLLRRGINPGGL